jgi:uncharacterized protein (TIGR02300 family)
LNRSPIVCPVCQTAYQVTPPAPSRRERAAPVAAKVVEPEAKAPAHSTAEVISLEEVEEAGAEVSIEEDEEIVDIGDDGAEIPAAGDDENAFLEEEEEGEADVSGIVGGGGNEES